MFNNNNIIQPNDDDDDLWIMINKWPVAETRQAYPVAWNCSEYNKVRDNKTSLANFPYVVISIVYKYLCL